MWTSDSYGRTGVCAEHKHVDPSMVDRNINPGLGPIESRILPFTGGQCFSHSADVLFNGKSR